MFPACNCAVFPLPFAVTGHCPATNYSFVRDAIGVRKVKTTVVAWHLQHGPNYKNGPCKKSALVLELVQWPALAILPVQPTNAAVTVGDTKMVLTRTQSKSGKYYTFGIAGVRGQLHIAPKMLQGTCPDTIEVSGPTFAEPQAEAVDKAAKSAEKAQAKVAKAVEKAAKAEEKARTVAAKAEAAAKKAQERAAAALAKANKGPAAEQPNL